MLPSLKIIKCKEYFEGFNSDIEEYEDEEDDSSEFEDINWEDENEYI
jgi:hypothetical protein